MPYEIRKQGGKFAVAKTGGKVMKAYASRDDAIRYMRALYANEPDGMKASAGFDELIDETIDDLAAVSTKVPEAEAKFPGNKTPNLKPPDDRPLVQQIRALRAGGFIQISDDALDLLTEAANEEAEETEVKPDSEIELAGITASAAGMTPDVPPADWFKDPQFDGPTPLTVTPDGKVFGHVAQWGTCHTGIQGRCVTVPPSESGYAYFNLAGVRTDDGSVVPAGKITMDTGHAPLSASSKIAASHYDHTGVVAADVRAGEDEYGPWVVGALRPDLDANQARALERATISGDWRRIDGRHEMVGLLAVNVPGFPIPRPQAALTASLDGQDIVTALVAAGILCDCDGELEDELDAVVVESVEPKRLAMHGRAAAR